MSKVTQQDGSSPRAGAPQVSKMLRTCNTLGTFLDGGQSTANKTDIKVNNRTTRPHRTFCGDEMFHVLLSNTVTASHMWLLSA